MGSPRSHDHKPVATGDARAEAAALAAEVERLAAELGRARDAERRAREAWRRLRARRRAEAARRQQEPAATNEELADACRELERRLAEHADALAREVSAKDAALRRADQLMAELHHRVGNSLQLAYGLLTLHAVAARDGDVDAQFRRAAARMRIIAAVYRPLYQHEGHTVPDGVAVRPYLEGLVRELLPAAAAGHHGRRVVLSVEPGVALPVHRVAAVGLVTAELLSNALRHSRHWVSIAVRPAPPGAVEIIVEDDGPGFPPGFDPGRSHGLVGLRVVAAYAAKPDGVRVDRSAPGGRIVARLPA